jgi:hypothetical protein
MQVQQAPRFGRLYTAQETRTVMAADDGVKGCIGKRNKVIAIYYESGSERGTDSFAFRLTGYQSRIVRYTMHVQ